MPLRDLTPQLRTRLSRVERAVGLFLTLATLLLLAGFGYYIYNRAESKGWFLTKVFYQTGLNNAAGIKTGDPVKLMGFNVGEVTKIVPNEPGTYYGVTVEFRIKDPYFGYIWLDSKVRIAPSDFLGNRYLEVVTGKYLQPSVRTNLGAAFSVFNNDVLDKKFKGLKQEILAQYIAAAKENHEDTNVSSHMVSIDATNQLNNLIAKTPADYYTNAARAKPFWIEPIESAAVTERLQSLADTVELALPNILNLTNQIASVLTNASGASRRIEATVEQVQPILTNLSEITSNLRNPHGAMGEWLLPTNLQTQIQRTLADADEALKLAHSTLDNTDTNLTTLALSLDKSLENLANLTSNLNAQVQSNTNMLGQISTAITHTDELVQGLKHHWFLRSAFKPKKADPVKKR